MEYQDKVKNAVLEDAGFVRLTLTGAAKDKTDWIKITVRPVRIKEQRMLQFMYFDARKSFTKNFPVAESAAPLDEALALNFSHIHVQSSSGDLHIRITRKGKALISQGKASCAAAAPDLSHNKPKQYMLDMEKAQPFLQAVGIADSAGHVRPTMQAKFHQINEFLRVLDQVLPKTETERPLYLIDCGCGSAYLAFAAYAYLIGQGKSIRLSGIDTNQEVIGKCLSLRNQLGWTGLDFHVSAIQDFSPDTQPDVVMSLHACDTATDEAIARGVHWNSAAILAAPCCQHELHHQLNVPLFRPTLRHGILRERMADLLTDTFRALALRIMNYRTNVIEFISSEHTAKNLMIRAEKGAETGTAEFVREYKDLKEFWSVSPAIERLLGEKFQKALSNSGDSA